MLTTREVCERLSIHPKTLRKIIRNGDLAAVRVGSKGLGGNGAYRISEEALQDYLNRKTVQGTTS